MKVLGFGLLAMFVSTASFGAEYGSTSATTTSPFQNHLNSKLMVSPAQIYQTTNVKTDFQLGYKSAEGTTNPDAAGVDDIVNTNTTTDVFGAGVYTMPDTSLTLAVSIDYGMGTGEVDDGTTKNEADASEWTIMPQAAYAMGNVVLGLGVKVHGMSQEVGDDDFDATYATYVPGILYAADNMEAGLAFETAADDKGDVADKELAYDEPAVITVHGRYAVTPEMAIGAIINSKQYSGIDDDLFDDRYTIRPTVEYSQATWKLEGDLAYNTAFNKEDDALTGATMSTFELGTAADFKVHQNGMIGGLVRYEFGSDENKDLNAEYAVSNFDVGVRGNWTF